MKKQRSFEEAGLKVYVALIICLFFLLNTHFLNTQNSIINLKCLANDALEPVIGASVNIK